VSKRDYYEILGVAREATDGQIKSAYRKLALKFHPDRNPGDAAAEEAFKEAAEAYSVLADPQKRALFDRFGHAGVSGAGGAGAGGFDPTIFADFSDIFSGLGDMFGFGGGTRRRRGGPQRGSDLRYDLEITFDESATGTETAIHLPGLLSFASVSVRGNDVYRVKPEQGLGLCRHTAGKEQPTVLCPAASICPRGTACNPPRTTSAR